MERQRDHIGARRKLGQKGIRRRAGRAALRGKELDHHRRLRAHRARGGGRAAEREDQGEGVSARQGGEPSC
ncbi:MAG: hypothetical protein ACO3OO_11090 [Gemmobacter sp.]